MLQQADHEQKVGAARKRVRRGGRGRRGKPGGEEIFSSAKTPAGAETPAPALAPGHAMSYRNQIPMTSPRIHVVALSDQGRP